MRKRKEL